MKKLIGGCLLASLVLLGGCESQPKINEEDLLTQLDNVELDIKGIYSREKTDGSWSMQMTQEFTGKFQDIQNLVIEQNTEENTVKVTFETPIGNEYYHLTNPQVIQAIFTWEDEQSLILQSTEMIGEEPLLVEPTYPFNVDYLLNQDLEVLISIPKEQYSEELGFDINENLAHEWSNDYWFKIPLSEETVDSVVLEFQEGSYTSPFNIFSPKLVITFKNGLNIRSYKEIYYSPNKTAIPSNPSDCWQFNIYNDVVFQTK